MKTILAAQTAASTCPPGCLGHDLGDVHMSADRVVVADVYGPSERTEMYVSLERHDALEATAVRLSGAGDAPMTPEQAVQLGLALIANGVAAMTTWQVTR